jgi:hypothetical protein
VGVVRDWWREAGVRREVSWREGRSVWAGGDGRTAGLGRVGGRGGPGTRIWMRCIAAGLGRGESHLDTLGWDDENGHFFWSRRLVWDIGLGGHRGLCCRSGLAMGTGRLWGSLVDRMDFGFLVQPAKRIKYALSCLHASYYQFDTPA